MRRVAFFVGFAGLCACGDPPPVPEAEDPPPSAASERAAASVKTDPLDAASECLARTREPITRALRRFDDALGEDGRPNKRTSVVHLGPVADELAACPPLPDGGDATIVAAYAAYVDAVEGIADLTAQLHPYYRDEGFKKDDWATSEMLAPKLREAQHTWTTAGARLRDHLRSVRDTEDAARLKTLAAEASGTLAHRAAQTFDAAKTLHDCLVDDAAVAEGAPTERCASARATLREASDALGVAARRDPDVTAAVFWFDAFDASVQRYTGEADAMLEPRKKKPKPAQLAAAREDLDATFVTLERDFRRLDFSFPS